MKIETLNHWGNIHCCIFRLVVHKTLVEVARRVAHDTHAYCCIDDEEQV